MKTKSKTGAARVVAVMCAAVFTVAMFGAGAAGAATKTTVKVSNVPDVGAVVATPTGMTLYTLTDANGAAVACTDQCLSAWPPYVVSATAKIKVPKGVKSITATSDTNQVAWKGLPLYTFAGDSGPKIAKGEGLASFGGTWHVVKVAKKAAATAPTTASSSSSYSGY
jgi:predicted lipoprotein with Yx(FWY)xxD motif